jgi:phosphoserine phosphatase
MRLVIQGKAIDMSHRTHVLRLLASHAQFKPVQFKQISPQAYYLSIDTELSPAMLTEIKSFCLHQFLDCALVSDKHQLSQFGLCVMDMDSTLINIECIDEIADMMNLKPQVSAITERSMRGEIDFVTSIKERVSLLKGLDQVALRRVIDERLRPNPGAVEWIAACKANNIKTMLVSGGFTLFANHVKDLLGLDYALANTLEIVDRKLTGNILGDIIDADRKAQELANLRDKLGLSIHQTIAIGDGANDLKMMQAAEAGVAYHAKPIVQQQATYALNFSGLDGVANLFTA